MSAPDQPPLKIGEVYYLKRVSVYHQCTLRSLHEFESAAKVDYYADGEPVICRQSELITEDQYKAVMKQRIKEAYERDLPIRRERAKAKYAKVIEYWNIGARTGKEMALASGIYTARGWGQMIAAAKRWDLLTLDDPKPSNPDSSAGG